MIKTLEAVIAIVMLLLFFLTISQTIDVSSIKTKSIENKLQNYLLINSENEDFKDLVQTNHAENLYLAIFEDIENNYSVSICGYLYEDCNSFNTIDTNSITTKHIDYYFYDINKIISIGVWVK